MDCRKEILRAKWILAKGETGSSVIERRFNCTDPSVGELAVTALGFFTVRLNGHLLGNEYFLPANSLFRERPNMHLTFPVVNRFTYRCYYTVYDLTPYLVLGENVLEIELGSGWYRQTTRLPEGRMSFGEDLGAIYAVCLSDGAVCSDGSERFRNTPRVYDQLYVGEVYDARIKEFFWRPVTVTELPDTLLTESDTRPDRIERRVSAQLVKSTRTQKVYDVGENISGFARIRCFAPAGYEVRIRFAENVTPKRELDFYTTGRNSQMQEDVFISDGTEQYYEPTFVWHGFRYVEVIGMGELDSVAVVHTDVERKATFHSSSEELNWLFEAYLRTQLNNMHGGVPSDCPHRERLGYTGDGQLCAPTAMMLLDTKDFYKKWMRDIFDSQDPTTGHVPYTAPFAGGGGGPGGWGGAAIYVPYYYYKAFGDTAPLLEYYERMKRWVSYLVDHSEEGLVVRAEPNGWCLGDWCTLETTVIPEPFVNTCLEVESLGYLLEIASVIGREEDIPEIERIRREASSGILREYYNEESGSFAEGIQGADAIALASGLGDARTFKNLVEKYRALGHFDTGIFGTPMLLDLLFERGEEDFAYALLTAHELGSFGYMMDHGATTIWEEWDGVHSHDHPMFGVPTHHLISSILGIAQKEGSAGYAETVIRPRIPRALDFAEGSLETVRGRIAVKWHQSEGEVSFEIEIPEDLAVEFSFEGEVKSLSAGKHSFSVHRK